MECKSNIGIDLNESPERENVIEDFEVDRQELKDWILSQIQSEDEIRWFETKYIRKIVTDLGGDVLKEFVEKLKELKREAQKIRN